MRPVRFLGNSLKFLRDFPDDARHDAGYQLDKVQRGDQPDDFQADARHRQGCRRDSRFRPERRLPCNLRSEARGGSLRLHAFHKKTQATPKKDLEIAKKRFGQLLGGRI
jgi:phage-related protein